MWQFIADQIDQLDLALDQLAIRDRNFDRFGLMLIDNVVELVLHEHARAKSQENQMWGEGGEPKNDPKAVAEALGQAFEGKVRLARHTGMISDVAAETIQYLHGYRNAVYHRGVRHEGILHALALFYFENACGVLKGFSPLWWAVSSYDRISHRAIKYMGSPSVLGGREVLDAVAERLLKVGASLGDTLIADLAADMEKTIEHVDGQIGFLVENATGDMSRREAVIAAQGWRFSYSEEARKWATDKGCKGPSLADYARWIEANYPWPVKTDPVPGWRRRLQSLRAEKDRHTALKKYTEFMRQTEEFREQVEHAESAVDAQIQLEIDYRRGK